MAKEIQCFFVRGNFKPILSICFQILDHFFLLFLPKDSNFFWILDLGKWGKKDRLTECTNEKKINFFCTLFFSKSFQIWDHYYPLLFPQYSKNLKRFHIGHQEVGAKLPLKVVRNTNTKKSCSVICPKNIFLRGDLTPFIRKSFQIWDHFLVLLFPKDSKSLKTLDIQLWEVGGKNMLKRFIIGEQTDKQTNWHMDRHFDL